jgi:hypothetical protein
MGMNRERIKNAKQAISNLENAILDLVRDGAAGSDIKTYTDLLVAEKAKLAALEKV